MNHESPFAFVSLVIGIIGGLLLLAGAVAPRFRASASRHLCVAVAFAGASALAWGTLGVFDRLHYAQLTRHTHYLVHHYKDMFAGAAAGILLLEFISGEFIAAHRRYRQSLREQRNPTTTQDHAR